MAARRDAWLTIVVLGACSCARRDVGLEQARRAVVSPLSIGAEQRIDEPVYTDRAELQSQVFAAAGGPGALVVWHDEGDSPNPMGVVYAARLDANGALLDPVGIPMAPGSLDYSQESPMAAWNGDRALVIWRQYVPDESQRIRAARVGANGALLDASGIDVATSGDYRIGRTPRAVIPWANDFLVFWSQYEATSTNTVWMARVGRDGSVTPREGFPIVLPVETPLLDLSTAVAVNGGIMLILSSGYTTFKAIKVGADGALMSPLSPAAGPLASVPVVAAASNGDTVLLFWGENMLSGQPVLARRLNASAAWIDGAPFELRPAGATIGGGYRSAGAVWNGSNFLCYWGGTSTGTVRVQPVVRRIAADGTPVDPQPVTLSGTSALTTAPIAAFGFAWTGDRYLAPLVRIVYTRIGSSGAFDVPSGVLARTVSSSLQPLGNDVTLIAAAPNAQLDYRAAGGPSGAYVVWQDDRPRGDTNMYGTTNFDLYGARVAIENGALGQRLSPIATTIDHEYDPAVGWSGAEFIVVHRRTDLFPTPGPRLFRRVGADGTPVGSASAMIAGAEASQFATMAWNGSNFLLTWIDDAPSSTPLTARRMSSTGTFLDATPLVIRLPSPGNERHSSLGVAAVGGDFVIAHQTNFADSSGFRLPDGDVYGAAVKADGTPSPTETLLVGGAGSQDFPALASDGPAAMLVWRDTAGGHRILAARLDANLTRLDGTDAVVAQATPADVLGAPAVAWTGTSHVALWSKSSGGARSIAGCVLGTDRSCVPGSEVAVPAGVGAPPPDAGASQSTEGLQNPSLVWTGSGGVFLYRRFDSAPFVNRMRLFARPVFVPGRPVVDAGPSADATTGGDAAAGAGGRGGGGGAIGGGAGGAAGTMTAGGRGGSTGGGAGEATGGGAAGTGGGATGTGGSSTADGCGCEFAPSGGNASLLLVALLLGLRRRVPGRAAGPRQGAEGPENRGPARLTEGSLLVNVAKR